MGYSNIIYACAACVAIIVAYGTYRCKTTGFVDPMTKSFFGPPLDLYLDGWGISHMTFFAILAYMFPKKKYLIFLFILGVLWEIVEYMAKDHPFYISKCNYNIQTDKGEGWWYGRWQDIVMNTAGIALGSWLARKA